MKQEQVNDIYQQVKKVKLFMKGGSNSWFLGNYSLKAIRYVRHTSSRKMITIWRLLCSFLSIPKGRLLEDVAIPDSESTILDLRKRS